MQLTIGVTLSIVGRGPLVFQHDCIKFMQRTAATLRIQLGCNVIYLDVKQKTSHMLTNWSVDVQVSFLVTIDSSSRELWSLEHRTIVRFTNFVASIFRDFFKSIGQNKTERTLFERIFNVASDYVISAANNSLLTM